jgi:hypothetical protein
MEAPGCLIRLRRLGCCFNAGMDASGKIQDSPVPKYYLQSQKILQPILVLALFTWPMTNRQKSILLRPANIAPDLRNLTTNKTSP